jgi:two-component system response regulator MprA
MTRKSHRILIAEDVTESRQALKLLLEFSGLIGLEAADGREAKELALREQPDLILMDLSLPVLDGLQATREIRAAGQTTPIIVVSAYDDEASRTQAAQAGANDFLTKPLEFEQLKELIGKHCASADHH